MGDIGWQELLIIFVILLLLFGATRLPALSKSLGQSIRGFRQALKDEEPEAAESGVKATPPVPTPPTITSTAPSVSRQISSAVVSLCAAGLAKLANCCRTMASGSRDASAFA